MGTDERDHAARKRDRAANLRDMLAAIRDKLAGRSGPYVHYDADHEASERDRMHAMLDREAAASDREAAARERHRQDEGEGGPQASGMTAPGGDYERSRVASRVTRDARARAVERIRKLRLRRERNGSRPR